MLLKYGCSKKEEIQNNDNETETKSRSFKTDPVTINYYYATLKTYSMIYIKLENISTFLRTN